MSNIIQEAKEKIYNSEIMLFVTQEQVETVFQKIHLYSDEEEFKKIHGITDNKMEGANIRGEIYISPKSTPHTVIHEVLHELSSEFDKDGHRLKNGIMEDKNQQFAKQVNEGLTDYLAAQISEEAPRHYIQGHKLFKRLEPMIIKYTQKPYTLMEIYLSNDVAFLESFLNYYGKGNVHNELYERFLFMNDEKLNTMMDKVEKNVNKDFVRRERKQKIEDIISKIKSIFSRKNIKMLPEGKNTTSKEDLHQQFVNKYEIDNFQTEMPIKENQNQYYQINKSRENENQNER